MVQLTSGNKDDLSRKIRNIFFWIERSHFEDEAVNQQDPRRDRSKLKYTRRCRLTKRCTPDDRKVVAKSKKFAIAN